MNKVGNDTANQTYVHKIQIIFVVTYRNTKVHVLKKNFGGLLRSFHKPVRNSLVLILYVTLIDEHLLMSTSRLDCTCFALNELTAFSPKIFERNAL